MTNKTDKSEAKKKANKVRAEIRRKELKEPVRKSPRLQVSNSADDQEELDVEEECKDKEKLINNIIEELFGAVTSTDEIKYVDEVVLEPQNGVIEIESTATNDNINEMDCNENLDNAKMTIKTGGKVFCSFCEKELYAAAPHLQGAHPKRSTVKVPPDLVSQDLPNNL